MSNDMGRYFGVLWSVASRVGPSQISVIAAGVAFYALLAVFPAIAAVIALAGLFIEPEAVVTQFETLARFIPEDAARILIDEASSVAAASDDGLTLTFAVGIAFTIYLSTRATTALVHGLNAATEREESRGIVRYWATVVLLTAALVFGTVILFLVLVGTPAVLAFIPSDLIAVSTAELVRTARWILLAAVLLFGLSVLYRFGPAAPRSSARSKERWHWLTPGSTLAGILWFAGSFGFSLYVTYIADYNASFGSLGGVIVLLTWLWLSAYVVLLGALLDHELRRSDTPVEDVAES